MCENYRQKYRAPQAFDAIRHAAPLSSVCSATALRSTEDRMHVLPGADARTGVGIINRESANDRHPQLSGRSQPIKQKTKRVRDVDPTQEGPRKIQVSRKRHSSFTLDVQYWVGLLTPDAIHTPGLLAEYSAMAKREGWGSNHREKHGQYGS